MELEAWSYGIDKTHCKNIWRAEAIHKAPSIKQKEQETQTGSKHTQFTLCVEPEFMENVGEYLDAITPEKCIISNFNETSNSWGQWQRWLRYKYTNKI